MAPLFSIAHVTPYPWEAEDNEVNAHIGRVARRLSERGHRVLVIAPSRSQERVRASRRELRGARGEPLSLLAGTDRGEPRVIAVGEVLDFAGGRRRPPALPIDVARTIEELLGGVELDFVHVHEPFAPSTANGRAAPLTGAERGLVSLLGRAAALDGPGAALRGGPVRSP